MTDRDSGNKSFTQKDESSSKAQEESKINSIVKACLPFSDLLDGPIVHLSFDCPKNLRLAFKQATHSTGQTVCFVLRGFMQQYIVSQHYRKACFPNTLQPVKIENMILPTYVKSRVRRVQVVDGFEDVDTCRFCGGKAIGKFRYKKTRQVFPLCEFHAKVNLESKSWEEIP